MSEFSQFVYSLSRLYRDGKIKKESIDKLLKDNKINQNEYDYIMEQIVM